MRVGSCPAVRAAPPLSAQRSQCVCHDAVADAVAAWAWLQAARREVAELDPGEAAQLLEAVEAAQLADRFCVFVAAPCWDEAYVSKNRRREFYNRLVSGTWVGGWAA